MVGPALLTNHLYRHPCSELGQRVGAAVLDADGKGSDSVKIGQVIKLFQDAELECVVYTSPSNQDGGRFRVVVPLKEPVDVPTQIRMPGADSLYWDMLAGKEYGHVDEGKSNPYHCLSCRGILPIRPMAMNAGKLLSETLSYCR